jgi:hypothetical protein
MPVILPTLPGPSRAEPVLLDFHTVQRPFLGGPVNHIDRLGTRFGITFKLPPMRHNNVAALEWIGCLLRGKLEGVIWEWPQPDLVTLGDGLVKTAVAGGNVVNLKGMVNGSIPRKGAFFAFVHGGRRYIHNVFNANTVVGGETSINFTPALRVPLSVDDAVEFGPIRIQGYLEGENFSWTIDEARTNGLEFTIVEEE